jgi:2-oxoglutarate/2-oxoacid ferredoxin oxidoreductase subunit beta
MPELENKPILSENDFQSTVEIAWCPGCGNFGILKAVKKALVELNLEPHRVLMVSGIGQAGKFPHFLRCNHLNELHGRSLPAAAAAKIVNPELTVFAVGGDGDGYGEGGNHFLAAMQRNVNIKYLVHNNQVYGLTKGQASPTSDAGFVTKTTLSGAGDPLNPLALAIASNASFVARSFSADTDHLSRMIKLACQHKGFALIDILQPCVSFNHVNTYEFYKSRVYKINEDNSYDPSDRMTAFKKSLEWGEKIPIGLFYQNSRPLFEDKLESLKQGPLPKAKLNPGDIEKLLDEFV